MRRVRAHNGDDSLSDSHVGGDEQLSWGLAVLLSLTVGPVICTVDRALGGNARGVADDDGAMAASPRLLPTVGEVARDHGAVDEVVAYLVEGAGKQLL